MMRIPIDRESDLPIYQQIVDFLRQTILSGSLVAEMRLPSTRQMAHDLGINRITVENAYAALEADGLIQSRANSGTYVLPLVPATTARPALEEGHWPLWQQRLPDDGAGQDLASNSGMNGGRRADLIDFARGSGDQRLFPVEEYRRVIQTVLHRDGMAALDYGEHRGYAPLRATIAQILTAQGIPALPDQVLVTAGSQQAIVLVSQLLLKPGDTVLVERPTYALVLDFFRSLNVNILGVPVDEHGMQVDRLEELLKSAPRPPRLLYTIPNFHNPTGACLNSHRRRQVIALSERYNLPILEDDYVGDLRYEGRAQPALKALDPGGQVIYASTFSKMLMPGLRVGFLVAQGPVYQSLVRRKHLNDLTTSNLHQRALEAYVTVGRYQAHLRRSVQIYRRRRDAMLEAIDRCLPATVSANTPQGGLFLWLRLPETLSADALLPRALEEGVSFSPGSRFFADGAVKNYLRLNFASQPEERIEEGIRRLGRAMGKSLLR
jgi:GntR family transcriptional regulator/MocR family aminotransferase